MTSDKQIASLVEHPDLIRKEDLEDLLRLTAVYPYAETFSLLYLLGLKKCTSIEFDRELPRFAFRISNREHLYWLVSSVVTEAKEILTVPDKSESVFNSERVNPYDPASGEQLNVPIPDESGNHNASTEKISDRVSSNEPMESDHLDQQILLSAVTNAYELPELSTSELEALENRKISSKEEAKVELKPHKSDPFQTFTGWLHANQNYNWELNKNVTERAIKDTENGQPDLYGIIEKPKTAFFSPSKKAKESLSETSLPVSETLAKIYVLQGNYPKAISAYEQLILKFPEKKTFFANLIRDLKKQINS